MNKNSNNEISNITNVIAKTLVDLRELNDYTQKEVAEKLCVTVSAVSHYENGISIPPSEAIIKLANLYNVSTDYLLNRCVSKTDFTKTVDIKLSNNLTIANAVDIMRNMSKQEKEFIAHYLDMVRKFRIR